MNSISKRLGLNVSGHKDIDFVDINLDRDTRLFLDPCLIECGKDALSQACNATIADYFGKLFTVIESGDESAILTHLAHLGERNEARLGYGNGRNGKAKTAYGMKETLSDLNALIQSGIPFTRAIDIPLLMPGFAEDCMSDMLMNILYKHLSEYTIEQCRKYGYPTTRASKRRYYWNGQEHKWAVYEGESLVVDGEVVLLIPKVYVCKRFYYSTAHFFLSKIAPMLQLRDKSVVNGKDIKPNKQIVRRNECILHGTLLQATRAHVKINQRLLVEYHQDIPGSYSGRCLSNEELDWFVYNNRN